jgi:excisionase family DNA binding protein
MESPASAVRPRLVSIQDCSVYIGLSVHTLYTMVSQRRIPFVKVGRLVKFDLVLVDAWIAKRTVMPITSHRS